jgi:small conductance mechanosensitive channel
MDFGDIERFLERVKSLGLDKFIYALLSLAIGFLLARFSRRWLTPILRRSRIRDDALLSEFILRSLSILIILGGWLAALSHLGFDVGSFLAGLGLTGLILGFGLRDTLSNFASGLLLLIYRPFRAGELIEVEGAHGTVEELTVVNMQMTTLDGLRVIMPNSKVWGAKITNYSLAKRRRLEQSINVPANSIEAAIRALQTALDGDSRVLKDPAPVIKVSAVTGKIARLTIWVWTTPDDFGSYGNESLQQLVSALARADIPAT